MKKVQVEFSFGSTGNHGDWVMVSVESPVISILCAFFALDLQLFYCLVYGHTTLFVVVSYCYWFSWFFSCLFLVIAF